MGLLRRPPARRIALAAALLAAAAAPVLVRSTDSASTASTSRGATFAAAADWTPPSVTASVAQKTEGGAPGYVRPGGTYHVFAATQDSGNPPSGVASTRADVSAVTTGVTAASLSSGSYSAFGVTYNARTATSRTAESSLTNGARTYSVTVTDALGYTATTVGHTITIDGTGPTGTNLGAANSGSTVGKLEQGDFVVLEYDEPIDPSSVVGSWTGAPAATILVQVVNDDAANGGRDSLQLCRGGASGTPCAPTAGIGYVDLGSAAWVTATRTFSTSTIAQSANRLTITLGTPDSTSGLGTVTGTNMTWYLAAAYDRAGNLAQTTSWSEGLSDTDF